jgi:uncharacterized protein (DUF433 family)
MSTRWGDPRDCPNYSVPEVARWLRLKPQTLRAWCQGRSYPSQDRLDFQPLIQTRRVRGRRLLSFTNVVESHVLGAMRFKHSVSMHHVRRALEEVAARTGTARPLATAQFETDGVRLLVREHGSLLEAVGGGQLVMEEMIHRSLRRIERDEAGLAAKLYPFTDGDESDDAPRIVVIDPRISFGRPIVQHCGVTTAMIAERVAAGDSPEEVAADYACDVVAIREALRWERVAAA